MKPILFSTPMVEAILEGRKTQTRRLIKSRHESGLYRVCTRASTGEVIHIESLDWDERNCEKDITPKYKVGDILYVKETWQYGDAFSNPGGYAYKADTTGSKISIEDGIKWKPSLFMPKNVARIFLEVTGIRVERLTAICNEDAIAEGIDSDEWTWGPIGYPDGTIDYSVEGKKTVWYRDYSKTKEKTMSNITPVKSYKTLWELIHGVGSWDSDPFVWIYEFKKIEKPSIEL